MTDRTARGPRWRRGTRAPGFSAIELIVVIGIVVILASIFIPYVMKVREEDRRIRCRDHLAQIRNALTAYAHDHGSFFPVAGRVDPTVPLRAFSPAKPPSISAATGPSTQTVDRSGANNVTASLWLLVSGGYLVRMERYQNDPGVFLCPSRRGTAAVNRSGEWDFPGTWALGYSYAAPFSANEAYRLTDVLKPEFVLIADMNPGTAHRLPRGASLLEMAGSNSRNHRGAGQNVLYAYGGAEWQITPYAGMNNDNIYTVRGGKGATQPTTQPATENGATDLSILPSADDDSFLLPAEPD